jgi:hypothetical protein
LSDTLTDLILIAIFVGFAVLRWWLGYVIGNAAVRRGCGYMGWIISSLIFGPLVVWIVYLIFVHWRPTNFGIPYQGDAEPPFDENS